jgi:hypothetical protein
MILGIGAGDAAAGDALDVLEIEAGMVIKGAILGLETSTSFLICGSGFFSIFFGISLILIPLSFFAGGSFSSTSACDVSPSSESDSSNIRFLAYFFGVEPPRFCERLKISIKRSSRIFSSGSHVLCR